MKHEDCAETDELYYLYEHYRLQCESIKKQLIQLGKLSEDGSRMEQRRNITDILAKRCG
jgi:hypothetical protein